MSVHKLPGRSRRVLDDPRHSRLLAPDYYRDPAIFEWEKEHVFYRSWIYAGHASQVAQPGDVLPCTVLEEPLLVTRDSDQRLSAYYNVCTHRGMRIVKEPCNRRSLVCPYHGWTYDLRGKLVRARRTDHLEDFPLDEIQLRPVRVEEIASLVFVNLDEDAAPIAQTIGPMFEDIARAGLDVGALRLAGRKEYRIQANWKVVVDNFLESYHSEIAHLEYVSYAAFDEAFIEPHEWYTLMGGPSTEESLESLRAAGQLEVAENRYNWGFPTFAYLFYSGPANFYVWEFIPTAHDETIFRRNIFVRPGQSVDEQSDALDDQLTREDIALIEGVWKGINSRGLEGGGHYVINAEQTQQSEAAMHAFHRLCQKLYDKSGI